MHDWLKQIDAAEKKKRNETKQTHDENEIFVLA